MEGTRSKSEGFAPSLTQIIAIRLRYDLPAVGELHRDQIVSEEAWRQLAPDLDEGGLLVGTVDGDDEILARLAFGLAGGTLAHAVEPVGHGQHLQLTLLDPAQIRRRMEDGAELFGITLVKAVEIGLHDGFDARTVLA